MHPDSLIASRLCYDRVKIREQTKHYQRLLEVKPTLEYFSRKSQSNKAKSVSNAQVASAMANQQSQPLLTRNETYSQSPL